MAKSPTQFLIAGLLAAAASQAFAQDRLPPGVRGPDTAMATRSVSKYLQLERALQDAIDDHRNADLRRLLVEDFAAHSAGRVDSMPMDAWMKAELGRKPATSGVRDMQVLELDDIAVVSFFLDRRRQLGGKAVTATAYVLDVWRQSAGLLIARYESNPVKPVAAPKRPSGRE